MDELNDITSLIRKDFQTPELYPTFPEKLTNEAELREKLKQLVSDLLDKDFALFLQLMYRIDISETALKEAMTKESYLEEITELIILREKQKVFYRKKYS